MTAVNALELNGVYKTYQVRGGRDQRLGREGHRRDRAYALRDISFTVPAGTALGIVGDNGSGKSTLLRIMAGVTGPTHGTVTRTLGATGLLDLAGGLLGSLTGAENAVTLMMLAGLGRHEAVSHLPNVAEYAQLDRAFDWPVRSYSSGMRMRLAFAALVEARPRLLLLDEVLAVGDRRFRSQCLETLQEFRAARDVTLAFTSHDGASVRRLCEQAVWLEHGRMNGIGPVDEIMDAYEQASVARPGPTIGVPPLPAAPGPGPGPGGEGSMQQGQTPPTDVVVGPVAAAGEQGAAALDGSAPVLVTAPVAVTTPGWVRVQLGVHRGDEPTACAQWSSGLLELQAGRSEVTARFAALALPPGEHRLTVGVFDAGWGRLAVRWREDAVTAPEGARTVQAGDPVWSVAPTRSASPARPVFVVSERRTGSNLLMDLLCQYPGVRSAGELLHSGQYPTLLEVDRPGGALAHIDAQLHPQGDEDLRVGKLQFEQMEEFGVGLADVVRNHPDALYVVLFRRELLDQYVSKRRAETTQEWVRRSGDGSAEQPRVRVEPASFRAFCEQSFRRYDAAIALLRALGAESVVVEYGELDARRSELFSRVLCPRLGREPLPVRPHLVKQRSDRIADALAEPERLPQLLAHPRARHPFATDLSGASAASG